jgi:dTDP-4-amino-4,6-dideoxygalactose transaminase
VDRAEIIREKGTNRNKFLRGEIDKYTWVDVGSSYLPSEIVCAFLYAQLELIEGSTTQRRRISRFYDDHLRSLEQEDLMRLPITPPTCESNHHLYYILLPDSRTRDQLMRHLNSKGIAAVSHYVPLHSSPMGRRLGYDDCDLPITEDLSGRLLRLPIYPELSEHDQMHVVRSVKAGLQHIDRKRIVPQLSLAGIAG